MTSPRSNDPQVLIVGAGPTGLALALWLARFDVRIRIIDKLSDVAPISRALGVHARTLEFYRQLGFAEQAVAAGIVMPGANLWARGRKVASVPFRNVGEGLTPYPFILDFAQDQHERLLIDRLRATGNAVERASELTGLSDNAGGIVATIRRANGVEERCHCAYVAGCDGSHSEVRRLLGVEFGGGTYEHLFYVADVTGRGPAVDNGVHVDLDEADLLAIFDMKGKGHVRLVGTLPNGDAPDGHERQLSFADVSRRPMEHLHLTVDRVNWFSTYRVHHRVASRFRVGRAFLLGDAAHVHSPVGAQGMNTGIGDAVNLAWKLAAVVGGHASESLLDTYQSERIAFARRLVATTDRLFAMASKSGRVAALVRTRVFPAVVTLLYRPHFVRRYLFRTVSQIEIRYRKSRLSEGKAGAVHGGDRLPWVQDADDKGSDNYETLKSLRWQAHIYGEASIGAREACDELGIELHVFRWKNEMKRVGVARDALYLIRPDGYVALADSTGRGQPLRDYFATRGLRPR